MKYKVTLNDKIYEVEVEEGSAMLLDEYEAKAPAPVPVPTVVPAGSVPYFTAGAPAHLPAAPGAPVAAGAAVTEGEKVTAPLPGNVLSINVAVGDAVKAGQLLVIIEAMKMENEVLAPADGTVKQIIVGKGSVVATGDVLLVI